MNRFQDNAFVVCLRNPVEIGSRSPLRSFKAALLLICKYLLIMSKTEFEYAAKMKEVAACDSGVKEVDVDC